MNILSLQSNEKAYLNRENQIRTINSVRNRVASVTAVALVILLIAVMVSSPQLGKIVVPFVLGGAMISMALALAGIILDRSLTTKNALHDLTEMLKVIPDRGPIDVFQEFEDLARVLHLSEDTLLRLLRQINGKKQDFFHRLEALEVSYKNFRFQEKSTLRIFVVCFEDSGRISIKL